LPAGAVNLALKSKGGRALASSTFPGFDPEGVIDGNWTAREWGKGHGWQSGNRYEFPCWLEVRLPHLQTVDTVIIQTFPPVVRGRNWLAIRNYDLQFESDGKWLPLGSVAGNVQGTIVHYFVPMEAAAFRIVVDSVNTGDQENSHYDEDFFARILQVGIYNLGGPCPVNSEDVTVRVESGRLGNIAIYRDDVPASPSASSPEFLASVFRSVGYGVTFLNSKALSVPEIFNRENFDIFVHPYGSSFPVDTLLYEFLSKGGNLITLGGRPFTRALMFSPEGHLVDAGYDPGITTSKTRRSGADLPFREQLGMFYAGYEYLEDVSYADTAPNQVVLPTRFHVKGEFRGISAAAFQGDSVSLEEGRRYVREGIWPPYVQTAREGMAGIAGVLNNVPAEKGFSSQTSYVFKPLRSRWIPLVNAYDRLGKSRGTVIALMTNFEGPYRGSSWVFSGVDNVDLFSRSHPEFVKALLESLDFMCRSVTLYGYAPELDCYRQGEAAKVFASVDNLFSVSRKLALRFQFFTDRGSVPVFVQKLDLSLEPLERARRSVTWNPGRFDSDLYRVQISLLEGDNEIDRAETGFVVWSPQTLAKGVKVDFRNNYFQVDNRPQFQVGSRDDGLPHHGQLDENALTWDQNLAALRDAGMRVFSPVFFSVYIPGFAWGQPGDPVIPEQLLRLIDAQVQLAQRHGIIYAPCLFFVMKFFAIERPELSQEICAALGKRYATVPGIMFYIFDDGGENTPHEKFRQWARLCTDAFNSSGRRYVVLAEIGNRTLTALHRYGTEALAFPSSSLYDYGYPARYRLIDMRAAGKSFHISEFGVTGAGSRLGDFDYNRYPGVDASLSRLGDATVFLVDPHLSFGMGGAGILSWDWRDPSNLIFMWGLNNANDLIPKDDLYPYRNASYFFRHFQPAFLYPQVLVVVPKEHIWRVTAPSDPYNAHVLGVMDTLVENSIQFAVVDDVDLDHIPKSPHVLLYPDAQCNSPEILGKLEQRVRDGDRLWVSGDLTSPPRANARSQTDWFARIIGLTWLSNRELTNPVLIAPTAGSALLSPYLGFPRSTFRATGATVLATDSEGAPVIASHPLGGGSVFFTSDTSPDGTSRSVKAFLKQERIQGVTVIPPSPQRPVFELPLLTGGKVFTLLAVQKEFEQTRARHGPWLEGPETHVIITNGKRVEVPLGDFGVGLFAVREDGSIDALDGQGQFKEDGVLCLDAEQHVMAMSLDHKALRESGAIALFSIGPGRVSIATAPGTDVVEIGEISRGEYQQLEAMPTHHQEGMLTFQIDATQSRQVLLISSRATHELAVRLMNEAVR
jgi:hypothetical protein